MAVKRSEHARSSSIISVLVFEPEFQRQLGGQSRWERADDEAQPVWRLLSQVSYLPWKFPFEIAGRSLGEGSNKRQNVMKCFSNAFTTLPALPSGAQVGIVL
jgi:hypothetical protein